MGRQREIPNRIYEVEIDLVRTCNLHCKMCNFWTNTPNPERTTTEELKKAIKNLHDWFNRKFKIAFAGGEPFMRGDLLEIVKYASDLNIITTLITNGTLITPKKIDGLFESGLIGLTISIDSLNPQKHDYMRGVHGAFERAYSALMGIHKRRVDKTKPPFLNVASIVSSYNHKDVLEVLKFMKAKGIGNLIIQPLSFNFFPREKSWFENKLWPKTDEEIEDICGSLQQLIKMKKQGYPLINEEAHLQEMIKYFRSLDMWWAK